MLIFGAMKENGEGRLVSWKEIAAYLGCDVRTCLRWEKERGLPVHRPGGEPGPRVYAWRDELDAWLAGAPREHGAPSANGSGMKTVELNQPGSPSPRLYLWAVPLIIIGLGIAALSLILPKKDLIPFDFTIEESRLIILNKAKQPLWSFETGIKDLWSEKEYRKHFQVRRRDGEAEIKSYPALIIEDLDRDGRKEVLFVSHSDTNTNPSRFLYCFDDRGRRRWAEPFEGGKQMQFEKLFSQDYNTFFQTVDVNGDGRSEIIVISEQITDWPTQMVVLSPGKDILGEFWNSGRINDLVLSDVDGDGRKEILIGGVHNESQKAFIAIFSPDDIHGAWPEAAKFPSAGLSAGSEKAYILLPLTDIDPYQDIHAVLKSLYVLADGRIRGQIATTNLEYDLDPRTLACLDITFAINFKLFREAAVLDGKARGPIDEAYAERLKKGLLYWTGREWTSRPSWTSVRSK
jgi:hypothetical protein